jgi:hypothetical protein
VAVPVDGTGTASVMAPLVLGVQKPPRRVGKRFRSAGEEEGEETSGSENETRLLAARPPGREPSGLPRAARHGVRGRASLKTADGNHLVPRPDSDGEGAGAAAQNHVGAVVERLKGWNQAAPTDPDEGGGEQLAGQLGARIVPRQRRSRNTQGFGKFFDNGFN